MDVEQTELATLKNRCFELMADIQEKDELINKLSTELAKLRVFERAFCAVERLLARVEA